MMALSWNDLTLEEQDAPVALSLGPVFTLTPVMVHRLKALALAEQTLGGTIITVAGGELVLRTRLPRPKLLKGQ
jgi:hypothetical protein